MRTVSPASGSVVAGESEHHGVVGSDADVRSYASEQVAEPGPTWSVSGEASAAGPSVVESATATAVIATNCPMKPRMPRGRRRCVPPTQTPPIRGRRFWTVGLVLSRVLTLRTYVR